MNTFIRTVKAGILTVLLVFVSVIPVFAEITPEQEQSLKDYSESVMTEMATYSEEEIDEVISTYDTYGMTGISDGFKQWKTVGIGCGEFVGIDSFAASEDAAGNQIINVTAAYTNKKIAAVITIDSNGYVSDVSFSEPDAGSSLGQKMKEAGINLIVGMGTVFAVLIFLCWVISLFSNISKLEMQLKKQKVKETVEEKKAEILTLEPVPADSNELQAVIAAAIAAYESECGDSIEKQPALQNGISIKTYRRS